MSGKKIIEGLKEAVKHASDFKSSEERDKWIFENATYFTVIYRQHLRNNRFECKDFEAAEQVAQSVSDILNINCLIYAVAGIYTAFIKGTHPSSESKNDTRTEGPSRRNYKRRKTVAKGTKATTRTI